MEVTRTRIPQTLERLFLILAGLVVVLSGFLAFNSWRAYRRTSTEARAMREVVERTVALLSSLKDAETGQRGFLLTGEDRYLEPYRQAMAEILPDLDALAHSEAVVGRPEQTQRIRRLQPLVDKKLDELGQTIDLRRSRGLESALAIARIDRGKVTMDQIRALCTEIRAASYDNSNAEAESARTSANETGLIAVLGGAAIFAFLVFATISIERGTRQRQDLIEALQVSEEQVREGRDWLQTTLASIGDGVITTDAAGRITLLNGAAQAATGWTNDEAAGKPLEQVFVIRNEETGLAVESPVSKVLREGRVVGLANHTKLIAKDGRDVPIDDSAAPIRDSAGRIGGVVMVFRDVTTQRRAEAGMRLLASIVESSADAVLGTDLNGAITTWNRGAERIYGYSAAEAIGKPVSMLAGPERSDEMSRELEHIRRGEHVQNFETIRITKDGQRLNVSLTVSPIYDATGKIVGTSGIARDVTERVRARAEIAELSERLRITLSSIGDGVIATDAGGNVTWLNPVAEELTGWEIDEASGNPLPKVFRIVNEETRNPVESPVAKVLAEGRVVGLANHTLLIARDGREYAIADSAAPIRDAEGNIVGVVMVFRDSTDDREKEKRLAEQAAELRRTTNLMRPVVCFVRDLHDRITYWNPGAADFYGFSTEEAIGQVSHSLLNTKFSAPLEQILAQLRAAGEWKGELLQTHRDGHRLTVASRWAVHRDAEGRPDAVLEVHLDITQRKEAEEKLRVTNEALARANEDLSQFAFAASHDLQEPLRMITNYSQLLLRGYRGDLDGEAAVCVGFINTGTQRMSDLLSDLLSYTQLAGDQEETVSAIDLNGVFETALENCQAAIDETDASVTSDRLPTVQGQEAHFIQLMQNLISNSLKYHAPDRRPRIHVSAERQNGLWRIAVKDNGMGIAPEYHKQIFGVFKRLHDRTIPGTGIGLAICQRVVDRYGGDIWVDSQVNKGATFYFTLPAAAMGAAAQ